MNHTVQEPRSLIPSFAKDLDILLVDDDKPSLESLARMLQQYTFNVTTSERASAALSKIHEEQGKFKLVMASVNLPDMDSRVFLRELVNMDVPVILVSPERNVEAATEALLLGASLYLDKPISMDELKYVWQHALRKRERDIFHLAPSADCGGTRQCLGKTTNDGCSSSMAVIGHGLNGNSPPDVMDDTKRKGKEIIALTDDGSHQDMAIDTQQPKEDSESVRRKSQKLYGPDEGVQGRAKDAKTRKEKRTNVEEAKRSSSDSLGGSAEEKTRVVWTSAIQQKFLQALSTLGERNASPRNISELMNVPNLSHRRVASNLQKYKAQVRRLSESLSGTRASPVIEMASPVRNMLQRYYDVQEEETLPRLTRPTDFLYTREHEKFMVERECERKQGKKSASALVSLPDASKLPSEISSDGNKRLKTTQDTSPPSEDWPNMDRFLEDIGDLIAELDFLEFSHSPDNSLTQGLPQSEYAVKEITVPQEEPEQLMNMGFPADPNSDFIGCFFDMVEKSSTGNNP